MSGMHRVQVAQLQPAPANGNDLVVENRSAELTLLCPQLQDNRCRSHHIYYLANVESLRLAASSAALGRHVNKLDCAASSPLLTEAAACSVQPISIASLY